MSQFTQPQQVIDPIPGTVERVLNQAGLRQYTGQAQPVVQALIQREQNLMQAIVEKCVQAGMSQQQAQDICQTVGAHLAQQGGAYSQQGQSWSGQTTGQFSQQPQSVEQTLEDIQRRLGELEAVAQQYRNSQF